MDPTSSIRALNLEPPNLKKIQRMVQQRVLDGKSLPDRSTVQAPDWRQSESDVGTDGKDGTDGWRMKVKGNTP